MRYVRQQAIDVHSHVNFAAFDMDREEVIKRAMLEGVGFINVGTQKNTSEKAVRIASGKWERVWATVGLHPIHTSKSFHDKDELGEEGEEFSSLGEIFDYDAYKHLAENPKVVAIGECGLDYFRTENAAGMEKQKNAFRQQIELALEIDKPLMIHARNGLSGEGVKLDAYKDAVHMLAPYRVKYGSRLRGNVHFFAGNWREAAEFLKLGFFISFTGVITFAVSYDEVVRKTPIDMILTETDAPYATPIPHRGERNEPAYVLEVVKKIALLKDLPYEEVKLILINNAKELFGVSLAKI